MRSRTGAHKEQQDVTSCSRTVGQGIPEAPEEMPKEEGLRHVSGGTPRPQPGRKTAHASTALGPPANDAYSYPRQQKRGQLQARSTP